MGAGLDAEQFHTALSRVGVVLDPFVTFSLDALFASFDRNGDGVVDVADFGVGLSLLAAGSKSDKLSLAFRLFDADDDGFLNKVELWMFFRSFLSMLVAIAKSSEEGSGLTEAVIADVGIRLTQV